MNDAATALDRTPIAIAVTLELALSAAGLLLLWRMVVSPQARARREPAALRPWTAPGSEFLLFLLFVICGAIGFEIAASWLLAHSRLDLDSRLIIAGAAAFQTGMLAGALLYKFGFAREKAVGPAGLRGDFFLGGVIFLIATPILLGVNLVWQNLLTVCGLPVAKQDVLTLFANAHSPWMRGVLILVAVGVAPVTEETVFRWGLFRYLLGRVPRWLALIGPSLLFGALHVSWTTLDGLAALAPLVALGVIFSLAYERTGRIGTVIVAHALFNLFNVLMLLGGVDV